jgi:hypothetical protein
MYKYRKAIRLNISLLEGISFGGNFGKLSFELNDSLFERHYVTKPDLFAGAGFFSTFIYSVEIFFCDLGHLSGFVCTSGPLLNGVRWSFAIEGRVNFRLEFTRLVSELEGNIGEFFIVLYSGSTENLMNCGVNLRLG